MNSYLTLCDDAVKSDVPNEKFDWNALLADECIVGQWVRVKLNFNSRYNLNPITKRIIMNDQSEILALIWAVDYEHNMILAEFYDFESLKL